MISHRKIIERALDLVSSDNIIPMAEGSLFEAKYNLKKVIESTEEIDIYDELLFKEALAYNFCCLWRFADEMLKPSSCVGLPIYKYEFLSTQVPPMTYDLLYDSLKLLKDESIKEVC